MPIAWTLSASFRCARVPVHRPAHASVVSLAGRHAQRTDSFSNASAVPAYLSIGPHTQAWCVSPATMPIARTRSATRPLCPRGFAVGREYTRGSAGRAAPIANAPPATRPATGWRVQSPLCHTTRNVRKAPRVLRSWLLAPLLAAGSPPARHAKRPRATNAALRAGNYGSWPFGGGRAAPDIPSVGRTTWFERVQ